MVKNEKLKVVLARAVLFLVLFLMYLPILVLIVFSFTKSTELGTWTGFSLQLYEDLFENKSLMRAIGNTLLIALVSALVSKPFFLAENKSFILIQAAFPKKKRVAAAPIKIEKSMEPVPGSM